jgi:type IV secretion system pilin
MKTLKRASTKVGTLLAETAFFFMSILSPVMAQSQLEEGAEAAKPSGTPDDLFGQQGLFRTITNVLIFLIGAIAVVMLIVGGLRYVVSAGNDTAVAGAKNTILYAIIGLVVAFLAFAAVNFVIDQLNEGT